MPSDMLQGRPGPLTDQVRKLNQGCYGRPALILGLGP